MLNVESSDSTQPTSKTPLDYPAANDSITENGENVNSNTKKSPEEELKALEQELKKEANPQARAAIGEEQSKLSPHRLVGRDFFMGE